MVGESEGRMVRPREERMTTIATKANAGIITRARAYASMPCETAGLSYRGARDERARHRAVRDLLPVLDTDHADGARELIARAMSGESIARADVQAIRRDAGIAHRATRARAVQRDRVERADAAAVAARAAAASVAASAQFDLCPIGGRHGAGRTAGCTCESVTVLPADYWDADRVARRRDAREAISRADRQARADRRQAIRVSAAELTTGTSQELRESRLSLPDPEERALCDAERRAAAGRPLTVREVTRRRSLAVQLERLASVEPADDDAVAPADLIARSRRLHGVVSRLTARADGKRSGVDRDRLIAARALTMAELEVVNADIESWEASTARDKAAAARRAARARAEYRRASARRADRIESDVIAESVSGVAARGGMMPAATASRQAARDARNLSEVLA